MLPTFRRVHSNSKEVSYLPWQDNHLNLRTTCQQAKIFMWTKLPENLYLEKYLVSVAATSEFEWFNLHKLGRFSDDFRVNRSSLIRLNSLNNRREICLQSHILCNELRMSSFSFGSLLRFSGILQCLLEDLF